MHHLILIKHSLPEIIPTLPAREWHLSQAGQLRCRALARQVAAYLPDIIVSSLEPKAVETAQILARLLEKPFRSVEGLHEHDRSGVGFLGKEQLEAQIKELFEHPDRLVLGRETAAQARARFSNALLSVEEAYPDTNVAVVSHGTVITLFVEEMAGVQPFPFWKKLGLPSFVVFAWPGHKLIATVESVG